MKTIPDVSLLKTLTKFNQQVSNCVSLFTKLTISLTSKQELKFRLSLAFVFDRNLDLQSLFFSFLNLIDTHKTQPVKLFCLVRKV